MRAEITEAGYSATFTFLSLQRPQPVADVRFAAVSVCEVGAVEAGGGHHEVTQYLDSVGNLLGQSSCEGLKSSYSYVIDAPIPPRGSPVVEFSNSRPRETFGIGTDIALHINPPRSHLSQVGKGGYSTVQPPNSGK